MNSAVVTGAGKGLGRRIAGGLAEKGFVMWGSRAAFDSMRAQGGHIINIASISSLAPVPGLAVYAATKAAVLGYSISLEGDVLD